MHDDCGLTFQDVAQYSPQELRRLQLGFMIREQPADEHGSRTSTSSQERKIRAGQQETREEMLEDIGVH